MKSKLKRYIDIAVRRQVRRLLDAPNEHSLIRLGKLIKEISIALSKSSDPYKSQPLKYAKRVLEKVVPACQNGQVNRAIAMLNSIGGSLQHAEALDDVDFAKAKNGEDIGWLIGRAIELIKGY